MIGRVLLLVILVALPGVGGPAGAAGALMQVGCIQDMSGGPVEGCTGSRGLRSTAFLAISPDGRHVYATSRDADAIAVFARDPTTGALAQLPGDAGCLSDPGSGHDPACGTAGPLDRAYGVAVSPDGRQVYVAARDADAVTTFARDGVTGALSFVSCVADPGSPAASGCDRAPGLNGPVFIAIAPDGGSLLVAAWDGSAVLAFARDPTTGRLTGRKCVVDRSITLPAGCVQGDGLQNASSVAVSPDGRSVYATGPASSAVASFARNPATGDLTQLGCVSGDGNYRQDPDCGTARAIQYAQHVAISPDGAHVIAAATDSHSLILFARDPATGVLTQLPELEGCISDATDGPVYCRPGLGLALPLGIAFAPDGRYVYTGSFGYGSVADRPLRQPAGPRL
jgi:6-phosphogluconolactonase (cycloisomerase 2 family)